MLLRQENDWSAIVTPKTVALNQCLDRSRDIVRYKVIIMRMIVKVVKAVKAGKHSNTKEVISSAYIFIFHDL